MELTENHELQLEPKPAEELEEKIGYTFKNRELLTEGCTVYLEESDNPARKTRFDLVTVEKLRQGAMPLLVNMDSQIPNAVAEEWLKKSSLFPET